MSDLTDIADGIAEAASVRYVPMAQQKLPAAQGNTGDKRT